MNGVFSLMRKDILSFAKGKTLQQFCLLPFAFCIQISVYRNDKLKFHDSSVSQSTAPVKCGDKKKEKKLPVVHTLFTMCGYNRYRFQILPKGGALMKLLRQLFSRVVLVSLGIAIQLAWLFVIVFYLSSYYLAFAFALIKEITP